MSYCRFGWDGSEVYVYESAEGLTCCGCRLHQWFVCQTPEEMIAHLAEHRRAAQFVPEHAIAALWDDIPGAFRPDQPERPHFTIPRLMQYAASINAEMARVYRLLPPEERERYDLPPMLEARLIELQSWLEKWEKKQQPITEARFP